MTIYLSENIKKLRLEKGITQETLAEFLGVTFQSVSRWERGDGYPDITMLPLIASFFNVSVDDLLGVDKVKNEQKVNGYIELYDTMKLKDISFVFDEFKKAVKEFPDDFRILVRYMQLLQDEKIFSHPCKTSTSEWYEKPSKEIEKIYDNIQKNCIDDSIRIWAKRVMISNLLWRYDCVCNEDGKYRVHIEYLDKANEIINTLPAMCDCRELMATDIENYYETHKNTLEELIFYIHNEMFAYCLNCSPKDRIIQFESLQNLLNLIYPDGDFRKNCFNRLYNMGHLGHLYHQIGDDENAIKHLKSAAEYAKELDNAPDSSEKAKRFYNYGPAYRDLSAAQFMKTVMTEHYPLSEDFKSTKEFKEIISMLS